MRQRSSGIVEAEDRKLPGLAPRCIPVRAGGRSVRKRPGTRSRSRCGLGNHWVRSPGGDCVTSELARSFSAAKRYTGAGVVALDTPALRLGQTQPSLTLSLPVALPASGARLCARAGSRGLSRRNMLWKDGGRGQAPWAARDVDRLDQAQGRPQAGTGGVRRCVPQGSEGVRHTGSGVR
jgi:hypothetical protein